MDAQLLEILDLALRALFVLGLPVVIGAVIAGTLVALLQGAMSLQDTGLQYAAKILAVGLIVMLMWPTVVRYLTILFERAME